MNLPPKSGVIIYSDNVESLSQFYIELFGMTLLRATNEFVSIGSDGFSLVVHTPPIEVPKDNFNRVKVFLTVESHAETREKAVKLGGRALPGEWSNPVFKVCNIADPDENHIQIREFIRDNPKPS